MKHCIWYISKYLSPPARGSAGARGYLLMREIAAEGHSVVLITSDANPFAEVPVFQGRFLREERDGMTLVWIRTARYRVAKSFRRIMSWIDFELRLLLMRKADYPRPDCVVVSSLSLLTILNGLLLKIRYSCRLVFEVRDIWPLTLTEEGGFSPYNPFVYALALVERAGYKHADAIVGTMPNLGARVTEAIGRPKRTDCIPMGIDDEMIAPPSEDVRRDAAAYAKRYIPDGKFIVAHAGTIGITNALETFLECARAMQERSDVHFVIVGDGDLRVQYEGAYGHLPNLTFAPRVPKLMVQGVLQHCDLLYFAVHPSRVWDYGQSLNKVIDYMLSSKPIVASYSGYPSMITEAGCGTFVPAGDVGALQSEVLRYAALSPGERQRIGAAGRSWLLSNRTYKRLAQEYLGIMLGRNMGVDSPD